MLSPYAKLAKKLIAGRQRLGLSQRRLGWKVGCGQAYISQIETGRRPLGPAIAARLEKLFKLKPGTLTLASLRRGRPRLSGGARQVLRELASRYRGPAKPLPAAEPPRHPRAHRCSGLNNPFWPIAIHLGEEAAQEVKRLEARRRDDACFWRLVNGLHFDSWSEKRFLARLALHNGVEVVGVTPSAARLCSPGGARMHGP